MMIHVFLPNVMTHLRKKNFLEASGTPSFSLLLLTCVVCKRQWSVTAAHLGLGSRTLNIFSHLTHFLFLLCVAHMNRERGR